MNGKKKNFIDYIHDAIEPGSTLADDFFDELKKPGETADDLKKFFEKKGRGYAVNKPDCIKLLEIAKGGLAPIMHQGVQKY